MRVVSSAEPQFQRVIHGRVPLEISNFSGIIHYADALLLICHIISVAVSRIAPCVFRLTSRPSRPLRQQHTSQKSYFFGLLYGMDGNLNSPVVRVCTKAVLHGRQR